MMLARSVSDAFATRSGCSRPVVTHPHVERTVEPEREAALALVELHRRNADIHHDAVNGTYALRRTDVRKIREAVFHQRQTSAGGLHQIESAGDGGAVPVDADDAGAGNFQNDAAVAAGAERRVHIDAAVIGRERLHGLTAENRNVAHGGIVGRHFKGLPVEDSRMTARIAGPIREIPDRIGPNWPAPKPKSTETRRRLR